jgi:signal peptidase I
MIVRIAYILAFLLAGGATLTALTQQLVMLPAAFIPLAAGIGLLRKRVWSAYGFSLYLLAQLIVVVPVTIFRSGGAGLPPGTLLAGVLSLVFIPLFFLAGRSLAHADAARGLAAPWILLSALLTLPIFFIQPFVIPSSAMENTLLIGDRILVRRFPRPTYRRDDIVVFVYPLNHREDYVKRLIGIPGDRIRISNKVLYRNGTAPQESYVAHKTSYVDSYRDDFPNTPNTPLPKPAVEMLENHVQNGEVVVPEGKYFVLGDNRDNSSDSRYWGFVDATELLGKPLVIYDSEDLPPNELGGSPSSPRRIRWERFFRLL